MAFENEPPFNSDEPCDEPCICEHDVLDYPGHLEPCPWAEFQEPDDEQ